MEPLVEAFPPLETALLLILADTLCDPPEEFASTEILLEAYPPLLSFAAAGAATSAKQTAEISSFMFPPIVLRQENRAQLMVNGNVRL